MASIEFEAFIKRTISLPLATFEEKARDHMIQDFGIQLDTSILAEALVSAAGGTLGN